MSHKCKVARVGKATCYIHGLPIRTVKHLFERLVLDEYPREQLRQYHNEVVATMLDRAATIPMDDA